MSKITDLLTGKKATRLGAIDFVNTIPIYSAFESEQAVELIYKSPAELNKAILAGKLDISPVSSLCYLQNQDKLVLVDDLSVSSFGAVESVLFLSTTELTDPALTSQPIYIPDDSATSVALLEWALNQNQSGTKPKLTFKTYAADQYEKLMAEKKSLLIIGDRALLAGKQPLPTGYHKTDLSQHWHQQTGLPFVFAVWVARRDWADKHTDAFNWLVIDLINSKHRFFMETEAFNNGLTEAKKHLALTDQDFRQYWTLALDYNLGAEHQKSLSEFAAVTGNQLELAK